MQLLNKVQSYIQNNKLFTKGDKIIIGVSGGIDSIGLLHILYQLRHELALEIVIAHFNHQMRTSSKKDETFVKNMAEKLNLPMETGLWTDKKIKGSVEDCARQARQKFFERVAKRHKTNKIVLGHMQNDCAETVLMRLLKGSGLNGLQGIKPYRKIRECIYVRPLLSSSRKEIEQFIKSNKIKFINDPTNAKAIYYRNKLRLKLLPLLRKEYNLNIDETLLNIADLAGTDYDYLNNQALKAFKKSAVIAKNRKSIKFNLTAFNKAHPALKRMMIREGMRIIKGNTEGITFKNLAEIEDLSAVRPEESIVHLPKKLAITKGRDTLKLYLSK